ncbi:MAG: pyridoxamine 5'-phosphate oxidase family protein [Sphingomonadaceae bacterium]|nr:pyridoxamine 5'-phosphate oxidase family protein [Sphingomonadaceae bacterium]
MTEPVPHHATDLAAALAEALRLIGRGVADRRSAFHTPTLATIGLDGAPQARTVVLRAVSAPERLVRVHTDLRSVKAAELAADPRAALHFYEPKHQVQIRLSGRAQLLSGDAAEPFWTASRPMSRRCYASEPAPGTPIPAPQPAPLDEDCGRPNFAAIMLRFATLEWLWLWAEGHRRARFRWDGADWVGEWVAA